ncbi:hypothetical protein ACHHYP_16291 [Achlya hypogyna]|uniref:PiggyBac transposable element-derived protein domain-containing protein n=1 Tax=Achlya hypogyna TaxID=1202772 RepID=A0A1V9Y970_ACHHY|nr:hypothetical protein ACHHYP_16291 [Achlya hypogyna]
MLMVDECMSAWTGQDAVYSTSGLPHKTKIKRKPEGVGADIKSVACSTTGVLLGLDIMEGQSRQHAKPYWVQYGEGTAFVLRPTEAKKSTGRTVVANSAFASVKTLLALKERGLFFMGIIKTAHRGFPKTILQKSSNRNESVTFPTILMAR